MIKVFSPSPEQQRRLDENKKTGEEISILMKNRQKELDTKDIATDPLLISLRKQCVSIMNDNCQILSESYKQVQYV